MNQRSSSVIGPRYRAHWLLAVAIFVCVAKGSQAEEPGVVNREFIFEQAPHPQCHAATLVETGRGLVAAWFGGTKEGNPDCGIWLSRQVAGDWSDPVEVANGAETENPRRNAFNPVLFQIANGPLVLFYKTGAWWAYVKTSTDDGVTWTEPVRLPNGFFGPIKNKPVVLADGSILSPSSTEFANADVTQPEPTTWRVHFERSVDGGKHWQFIGPVNDGRAIAAIQPSILFHLGNRLQAIGRTRQGKLFEIWSTNSGASWGPISLMELPNPNSGTDAVTLRDGRQLLVYNHATNLPDRNSGYRSPLNVAVSKDGKAWQAALALEEEPRKEFSYPAVIQTSDDLIHIAYTWKREKICHVVLDPSKLVLRPIIDGQWPGQE